MLRVWVHGCDPGRVSDGSWLALCQTLSIECPSCIFFWHVYFAILVPFSFRFCLCFFSCCHWSLVDVPLISFCPADHLPDWQPRIVLGMVEARSVNVKKTTTTTTVDPMLLPRANPFKCHEKVWSLQPTMIPPKRFDIFPPDDCWGVLGSSRCVQIYLNIVYSTLLEEDQIVQKIQDNMRQGHTCTTTPHVERQTCEGVLTDTSELEDESSIVLASSNYLLPVYIIC